MRPMTAANIIEMIDAYPLGTVLSWQRLEGMSNTSFKVYTQIKTVVLRVYTPGHSSFEQIQLEIELLQHLARRHFPSPRVVTGKNGKVLQGWDHTWYSASEYIAGSGADELVLTPGLCGNVGVLLARFREALSGFEPAAPIAPHGFAVPGGDFREQLVQAAKDKAISVDAEKLLEQWERASMAYATKSHGQPYGIIHGDLWPPNVICDGETVNALIDFDACCYGAIVIDFAVALMEFSTFRSVEMNLDAATAFVGGYLDGGGDPVVLDEALLVATMEMACAMWAAWEVIERPALQEAEVFLQRLARFADDEAREDFTRDIGKVVAASRR